MSGRGEENRQNIENIEEKGIKRFHKSVLLRICVFSLKVELG